MARLRIRQIKSGCNVQKSQKATLRALGLRHHQAIVEKEDGAAIRGMVRAVRHLVQVEEIE
ncbi:MAG: 50S ribosomal protein L30 [Gemmatimonadota bacterium]